MRKIKKREISEDLIKLVRPELENNSRASLSNLNKIGEFYYINIEYLIPFKNQARKKFDQEALEEMSISIKNYGIRQPLSVKASGDGIFEIISGERRYRAAQILGIKSLPCIILNEKDEEEVIALIENIHRKDLHILELANAYKKILDNHEFISQEHLAKKLGISKSKISEYLQYSSLPKNIQEVILEKKIQTREQLRKIYSYYKNNNTIALDKMLNNVTTVKQSFTVLTVKKEEQLLTLDGKKISCLNSHDKQILKRYLQEIIFSIENS